MNIYSLELRNLRRSAMSGAVSLSFVIYAMLAFFPSMKTEAMQQLAGAKLSGISPMLLEVLGLSEMLDFSILSNYFGYVFLFVMLAVMVLVTQQAASLLIKEESDGTIEYLCAKPVSRADIFLQKFLAHLTAFFVTTLLCAFATVAGYLSFGGYKMNAALEEVLLLYLPVLFAGLVYSSAGILISAVIKSAKGSSGLSLALVFGTYTLGVIAALVDRLGFLSYLSPLDWIKAQKLISKGLLAEEWLAGGVIVVVCTASAFMIYRRKDLLV